MTKNQTPHGSGENQSLIGGRVHGSSSRFSFLRCEFLELKERQKSSDGASTAADLLSAAASPALGGPSRYPPGAERVFIV